MQAAEAELFKSRGAVVNISSICALKPANDDMMMGYHAAKAALDKITQVLPCTSACSPAFPPIDICIMS